MQYKVIKCSQILLLMHAMVKHSTQLHSLHCTLIQRYSAVARTRADMKLSLYGVERADQMRHQKLKSSSVNTSINVAIMRIVSTTVDLRHDMSATTPGEPGRPACSALFCPNEQINPNVNMPNVQHSFDHWLHPF